MASDDLKALLLEDYRYRSAGMASSEQSGETRINLFIGLITFCAGAIGAGYAKGVPADPKQLHVLALAVALALLAIGIVILCRMTIRNEHTDLAKHQLDLIRQTFIDHFDDSGALAGYDLFPKSGDRKFGGLTDLVAVVNGIIAACAVLFAVLSLKDKLQASEAIVAASVALAFLLALWMQRDFVRRMKDDYKKRHDAHFKSTHAGGIVYSADGGQRRYLIVQPRFPKPGKVEWVLPKGHIEKGEHPSAAAVREVGEEAGVFAKVVAELPPISFSLKDEPIRIRFYLMEKIGGVTMPDKEMRSPHWASRGEAIRMLSFDESKALVRRADQIISKLGKARRSHSSAPPPRRARPSSDTAHRKPRSRSGRRA